MLALVVLVDKFVVFVVGVEGQVLGLKAQVLKSLVLTFFDLDVLWRP